MRRPALAALHAATLALADLAALQAAVLVSFGLAWLVSEPLTGIRFVAWDKGIVDRIPVLVPIGLATLAWLHGRGRYTQRQPFWADTKDMMAACALAFVVEGFLQYTLKGYVSRLWIAGTWCLLPAIAPAIRAWMKGSLSTLGARDVAVLVLGDEERRIPVTAALRSEAGIGWRVCAESPLPEGGTAVRTAADARAGHVLVVGQPDARVMGVLRELSTGKVPYSLCLPVAGSGLASMRPLALVGHDFLIMGERPGLAAPSARLAKRAADIALAASIAALTWPVAAAAAVAVRLDGGPALYAQERIGRGGRTFRCLKLRTMVLDSDAILARTLASDPQAREEWAADRKLRNDPRITRAGRFLRTTAIDEWPQLLNIIRGDMSFVGPRPVTRQELERYGIDLPAYLDVRPGLTGLWQASGRNDLSYERRVALDAWYVRNWSAWLDFVVVMKTVPAVLARRGAY